MQFNNIFIHHVFFWLRNPESAADKADLVAGLRKLSAVTTIKHFHIGEPAETFRGVVERGYSVSWMIIFENAADQESYQTDPIHLQFVERCAHLWHTVKVHDSIDVRG